MRSVHQHVHWVFNIIPVGAAAASHCFGISHEASVITGSGLSCCVGLGLCPFSQWNRTARTFQEMHDAACNVCDIEPCIERIIEPYMDKMGCDGIKMFASTLLPAAESPAIRGNSSNGWLHSR